MSPCCEHILAGQLAATGCRRCELYRTRDDYRAFYAPCFGAGTAPSPPPRSTLCTHLGAVLDPRGCNCPRKHVRRCTLHGRCTLGDPDAGVRCCTTCPDFEADSMIRPEELTSTTPVEAVIELLEHGPVGPWPDGWTGWPNVMEAHRILLDRAANKDWRYPGDGQGRGIVSCVSAKPGHSSGKHLLHGYLPGAWVLVKELRRLGCTLPITFCHLGPIEWDPTLTELVKPFGVDVIDLRAWERQPGNGMRILAGWESKIAAILACRYEEVLFLDADNVPVADPTFLFDHPQYRAAGAVFWPDLPPYDRKEWLPEVVWRNAGLEYRDEVDFESGQLLIHKAKCWRPLQVTRAINEHSDYWYKQIFGDKSTFHLAWARCGAPYAMPPKAAGWNGGAILQHDLAGRLLFEHGAQNKPTLAGYPKGRECLTNPGQCLAHLDELRRLWNGRLWQPEVPIGDDADTAARLLGRAFRYRRVGIDERVLRFVEDNRIGRGLARCEVSWAVVGGTLCVSDIDGKPTFFATENGDGSWHGQWLEHERCKVELIPLGPEESA
jgi:hypothetical protein